MACREGKTRRKQTGKIRIDSSSWEIRPPKNRNRCRARTLKVLSVLLVTTCTEAFRGKLWEEMESFSTSSKNV